MSLHKSNFLEIHQMPNISGIKIKWLKGSENMKDEEFKAEILREKQAIETEKPTGIFADTLDMMFSIHPDLQEWHNAQIFPAFQLANVKKLGILVSRDLFAQISIEQLIDDGSEVKLLTKYFDDEEKAIDWLKS